ncbi:hypothetical protein BH09BAC5_BH09BAC5_25930 [soil metagenome]
MYLPAKGKINPYISINPLSTEYYYKGTTGEEWGKLGCDVVASFKMMGPSKWRIYFAPQIAGNIIYTPGHTTSRFGIKAGFSLGFETKD